MHAARIEMRCWALTDLEALGRKNDAKTNTAKAWSSRAQMTTNPTGNTNTMVLRIEATHRRFASI
jgi:hypothetical protein